MMRKNQRGNALWFILLAVFLLGGLTVLLNRGATNTEETGDQEKISIQLSEMIRYTAGIKTAVDRMLSQGVSENDISFANTLYKRCDGSLIRPAGHNPNCTTNSCEIFSPGGGGMKPVAINPLILADKSGCAGMTWPAGAAAINMRQVVGVGSAENDLMLEIYGLTKEACLQANRMLDVENPSGDPPNDEENSTDVFDGDYTTFVETIGDDEPLLEGKKAFCLRRPSEDDYHFFTVLIAR